MEMIRGSAAIRAWLLALLALAVWFACNTQSQPRDVAGAQASAESFSAVRAESVLARILGPEKPHPAGSAENAAVRARILGEFAKLGVPTQTHRAFTCNSWRGFAFVSCATVTDIIADAIPGRGKAVVLMAHYDSVPAGPGASDDESGVATVLETVRALKARGTKSLHPVIALITDGEEDGLLGANAFLQNAALKAQVGAVINVEARGTKGPSLLFQTSPGDGKLIDLYAKSVPVYATSSLYAEIYRFLPNDTDLTLFIRNGFPAFNFAFANNVRYYHSPLDIRANLDARTLQMHGDNLLGVAAALETTDFAALKGGNDVYMSLQGRLLPRMPARWILPLSVAILIVLLAAAWFAAGHVGARKALVAAAMPLLLIVGSALFGWALSLIAQEVSGHPDPAYAHPLAMRLGLGFAVWTATLAVSRFAAFPAAAASSWLWTALFGVAAAMFLPGFSPYFVFPAAFAALLLAMAALSPGRWRGEFGQAAMLLSAVGALFVWFPLVVSGESLMGLRLHPLFTIPAAMALMTVVPLLAARPMTRPAANASLALSAGAALALAVIAGLEPAYSKASPQRVDLIYFEKDNAPARWIADTAWKAVGTEPIPSELKAAGPFRRDAEAWEGLFPGDADVAPAGPAVYALPQARVVGDRVEADRRILRVAIDGSSQANGMALYIPKVAHLVSIDLGGQKLDAHGWDGNVRLLCLTGDCRELDATLVLADRNRVSIGFAELRYGLPPSDARLIAARPATAMPSQTGDEIILANSLNLPAR